MTAELNETDKMGRVLTTAKFENSGDLWESQTGKLPIKDVRTITVDDALVDTGCTLIGMPKTMIDELGLLPISRRRFRGASGPGETTIYGAVRLTIDDRECTMDVMEVPDDCPVLIGQLPLEHLDFVVDLRQQKLIGNPAHGGEHIYEMY